MHSTDIPKLHALIALHFYKDIATIFYIQISKEIFKLRPY